MTRYRLNYLARRNPIWSHEEFVARWRQHFRLASSMPEWRTSRRYIQCEVLHNFDGATYDGACSNEYHSETARRANREAHEYHRILKIDELETFESLVYDFAFVGVHDVLHGPGVGSTKLIRYLKREEGVSKAEFLHHWRDVYAPRLLQLGLGVTSYAQNIPIEPERPEGWGLDVDGIEEIWFDTIEEALHLRASEGFRQLADEFEDQRVKLTAQVITNEVILNDKPGFDFP